MTIHSFCRHIPSFLATLLIPASASASVITGGVLAASNPNSTFITLTPPLNNPSGPSNSVGNDTFQNPNLYAFNEDQNIVLTSPLTVDVIAGGGVPVLPAGTTVASHYVFFDPANVQSITGFVVFDSDVLAIITSTGNLLASDFLANTGVNYLNPGLRGLEPVQGDSVTIVAPRRIRVEFVAETPGDYIRVLTKFSPLAAREVPEPASLAVFGVTLFAAAAVRRGRRRRAV